MARQAGLGYRGSFWGVWSVTRNKIAERFRETNTVILCGFFGIEMVKRGFSLISQVLWLLQSSDPNNSRIVSY